MNGQVAVTAWYFANRPPYIDPPGHGETASIAVASSNSRAAGPHGHSPRATDDSAIYIDVARKSRVQGSRRLSLVRCLSPLDGYAACCSRFRLLPSESIRRDIQAGRCQSEIKNSSGKCCLGKVTRAGAQGGTTIRSFRRLHPSSDAAGRD